jgi:hypothetical protein
MDTESIPKFTAPAAARPWATIPSHTRTQLLSNGLCGKCRHEATITNFSGAVKTGDSPLVDSGFIPNHALTHDAGTLSATGTNSAAIYPPVPLKSAGAWLEFQ